MLGEIIGGEMRSDEYGKIAQQCWLDIPKHFPNVQLDVFVIMPNHIHRIFWIFNNVGARHAVPLQNSIVWQRNYYEHIIRNDEELNKIRQYIMYNPKNWEMDENYV